MTGPFRLPPLLQTAPVAIACLDLRGYVLDVNRLLVEASGYASDEIRQQHFHAFLCTEDDATARASFGELVRGERDSYREERRYRTRSGEIRDVEVSVSLLRDASGAPEMCLAVLADVTAHTRALADAARHVEELETAVELSEAQYRTEQLRADERQREATELLQLVVQQSGEAIVVADVSGVLRVFNPAAERLHGVAGAEPADERSQRYRLFRLDGTPLPDQDTPLYRALQGETVEEARWLVHRPDGSVRTLVGTSAPLRLADGSPAGAVLIARDETDRIAAEAEREALLFDTQRAHHDLEAASRLKDEFLATVSHELRTPLNAILGWTRILRRNRDFDPSGTAHALDVIERNAAAQARLIDDLLDVSRIITGKIRLRMEAVDLSPIVANSVESVKPAADAKGVRLDVQVDPDLPPINGDPQRLQQILWNLLSNAVKFNEPGGQASLIVAREGRSLRITVSDSGVGIAPGILPFVFDRFTQGDASSTRLHSGLGLGLAIVRHLVELHGGTVAAESPGEGSGATFRVCLPVPVVERAHDRRS